jgi:uncharacterized damage-inducible protein DinB
MADFTELVNSYVAGPQLLRHAVSGLSHEQLVARPVSGKWSALEVVCHIGDFDPILADRMKRVIAEDRPQLLGADENRFAAALAYHHRDVEEELTIIERTREQMARILRTRRRPQRARRTVAGTVADDGRQPHPAPRQVYRGEAQGARTDEVNGFSPGGASK